MVQWNIPPSKEVLGEHVLDPKAAQELMLSTFVEEQDKWNKDVVSIEQNIMVKQDEIRNLINIKDKWWERFLCWLRIRYITKRQEKIIILQAQLDKLHNQYLARIDEMPNVDRFELGMFAGSLFKCQ